MKIRAVPLTYNGTTYRSTLEADWAATFDTLGWYYEYEPWAVDLGDGIRYLADFHLPAQNIWCEVKGGHNQRMHKTRRFHQATDDGTNPGAELMVVLRAAGEPGRAANWHCVTGDARAIVINQCGICSQWCFTRPRLDKWRCRHCRTADALAPERQYVSAVHARAIRQDFERIHGNKKDYFGELHAAFPTFGRLPLAKAPRARMTAGIR